MIARLLAVGLALGLGAQSSAQGTTGVPGYNDYTIGGLGSGLSSCTFLPLGAGPTLFQVSTQPTAPVVLLFSINCTCSACYIPWTPTACTPIPPLGCTTIATEHAFELDSSFPGCALIAFAVAAADPSGISATTITIPAGPLRFSTQAVSLHTCAGGGLLWSQAYDLSIP